MKTNSSFAWFFIVIIAIASHAEPKKRVFVAGRAMASLGYPNPTLYNQSWLSYTDDVSQTFPQWHNLTRDLNSLYEPSRKHLFTVDPNNSNQGWFLTSRQLKFNDGIFTDRQWKILFDASIFVKLTRKNDIAKNLELIQIKTHPQKPGYLLLLAETCCDGFTGTPQTYVFQSLNYGTTWNKPHSALLKVTRNGIMDAPFAHDMEICPVNSEVWVSISMYYPRILRSTDGGKHFKELYFPLADSVTFPYLDSTVRLDGVTCDFYIYGPHANQSRAVLKSNGGFRIVDMFRWLDFIDLSDWLLSFAWPANRENIRQVGPSGGRLIGLGEDSRGFSTVFITQDGFNTYQAQKPERATFALDILDTTGPSIVTSSLVRSSSPNHLVSVSNDGAVSWDDRTANLFDTICSGFGKGANCELESQSLTAVK